MKTNKQMPLSKSLKEYARGIAGGLLFSLPLLFTMEMWWAGFIVHAWQLIIYILVTFCLLLGYNRFAGMRKDATWKEVAIDSVEEMGIGIVIAFLMLWMLNRIHLQHMQLEEILGKTILEAMAVAIGVSVGTAQLGSKDKDIGFENTSQDRAEESKVPNYTSQAVLALCGSILVGGNVAPTEEIVTLALQATPIHLLSMALVSLLLSVMILFFSDFKGSIKSDPKGLAYTIIFSSCLCYVISLLASAAILWFFGRFTHISFDTGLAQTITLGIPATLGASAGRLLIK